MGIRICIVSTFANSNKSSAIEWKAQSADSWQKVTVKIM